MAMSDEPEPKPYVNGLQEWFGESRDALYVIGAVYAVSALGVIHYARAGRFLPAAAFAALGIAMTLLHYWRDVVSEDLRHPRGDGDE